ncbi:uncharacterized protein HD556DRAFT_1449774 [Suillus plorans]|uniref:Uncharacterized protein n=1 Tax=Suillus plorans TaxID=116603 RepID=A0A9P7ACA0_9AGAM|nr:uncharacterized protein HD556DRAFT_1449774 [Suillus plorans]KAG1786397.1 hypothetical protein HD556DRAFT_1449774 [Suillus plorans]
MAFPTQDPIVLKMVHHSQSHIDLILSTFALLSVNQNQTKVLDMGVGNEPIEVPRKCADVLEIVAHQLKLYRDIASVLIKLPKAAHIDEQIMFYLSLATYLADVIYGFIGEVKQDGPKAKSSKWRSAHLDFHIALALQNSAFTPEHQKIALKKMNRTWAQFREKRVYKKILALTYQGLHKLLCADGEDMCGGTFEHKLSTDGIISELLKSIQQVPHAPETADNADTVVPVKGSTPASEVQMSQRPRVQATVEPVASSMHKERASKLKYADKHGTSKTSATIAVTGTVLSDMDAEGEQSDSACIANVFEIQEDAKKSTKGRKANRKSQPAKGKGKGKKKAAKQQMPPKDDSDDELGASESITRSASQPAKGNGKTNKKAFKQTLSQNDDGDDELDANESDVAQSASEKRTIKLTGLNRVLAEDSADDEWRPLAHNTSDAGESAMASHSLLYYPLSQTSLLATDDDEKYRSVSNDSDILRRKMRTVNEADLDPNSLPPILGDWPTWNRIAFERGNSQVFLKLGTWMLLRFRQLALLDMDGDVDGVVIPENPRTMAFDSEDQFLEALGMERLYSAIVHMESRPRFLSHLFHSLGTLAHTSDIGESNPRFWSISSPPPVISSMMSDMDIPWLSVKGEDTDVADEFDGMVIGDDDQHRDMELDQRPTKRKRTSSIASPPKKEGGRGPSKRPKEIPSPVPSESPLPDTIDEMLVTETEVAHMSTSAIASGITPSDTPLHDLTSLPSDANEDDVTKSQFNEDNITCPAPSNDQSLLSQVSDVIMDIDTSITSIPTEIQISHGDEALVDVADAGSSSITPTQVILPSQPTMDEDSDRPDCRNNTRHSALNHRYSSSKDMSNSDNSTFETLDLTTGVLGSHVPENSPTIKWKDGHVTILPAVYNESNVNVCEAVDIPIIRFMAEFPISKPGSEVVIHFPHDALARKGFSHAVGLGLSQNKPVVIRGDRRQERCKDLSEDYLHDTFAISPRRPVCIHGNVLNSSADNHVTPTSSGTIQSFILSMTDETKIQCILDLSLAQAVLPEPLR